MVDNVLVRIRLVADLQQLKISEGEDEIPLVCVQGAEDKVML
jgi:hypothetical protein